jgi:hypothetical protein
VQVRILPRARASVQVRVGFPKLGDRLFCTPHSQLEHTCQRGAPGWRRSSAAAPVREIRAVGRDVNVSVLTPQEWDRGETGFVTHLKSEPLVELDLQR